MSKVVIQVRYKQVQRKTGKTETYGTDELSALNAYLDQKYSETHDCSFMTIRLNFFGAACGGTGSFEMGISLWR